MPDALGPILAATVTVADLEYASKAYCSLLRYEHLAEGLSGGLRWRLLGPAGARWGMVRLEETPDAIPTHPFRTLGWTAIEVLVADVDVLHARCQETEGFAVIQPPVSVGGTSSLRALQVSGPGGEGLYLTQVNSPPARFTLPSLDEGEHRVFVAVVGSHDLVATRAFFQRALAAPGVTDHSLPVKVLNRTYGLPADSLHRISTLQLSHGNLVEVDEYPAAATIRPPRSSGISLVTFAEIDSKADPGHPRTDAPWWEMEGRELIGPFGLRLKLAPGDSRSA